MHRRRGAAVCGVALLLPLAAVGAGAAEEEQSGQTPTVTQPEQIDPDTSLLDTILGEDERIVPGSEYSLLGVSSEMDPYPGPGYVDGTAAAVFTDSMSDTWAVRYTTSDGQGIATEGYPHWIAFDTGKERTLTALTYAIKNQTSGPAQEYRVFVSNAEEAPDPASEWGEPVAEGVFPTTTPDTHTAQFTEPVQGRWVKFEILSSAHSGNVSGASIIRVIEKHQQSVTPPPQVGGETATPVVLSAGEFTVSVGQEFPQVLDYRLPEGTLKGKERLSDSFVLNGTAQRAETSSSKIRSDRMEYTSTFAAEQWSDLVIKSSLTIEGRGVLRFRVDEIEGSSEAALRSIAIEDQGLLHVDSSEPGATLSRTKIDTDTAKAPDAHILIGADTLTDEGPVTTPYAFVANASLAAGIYANSTSVQGGAHTDDRILTRISDDGFGAKTADVSPGAWVWAPLSAGENGNGEIDGRISRFENPEAVIAVTGDQNGSGKVDWQDAAIVLRAQIESPLGADRVPERVSQRIPFNFGSEATNPFLKTLDNLKRVSLATDGLGQWLLLKGYGAEGHDSANTDYGGHYNERAGGLDDLNALVDEGHANWNTDFAVHVNATEAYPQARSFSDSLTQDTTSASGKGWGWLNQSYYINQFYDLGSGGVLDRFQQLRDETNVDSVYIDVYYSTGWRPEVLADQLHDMGFEVATEWAHKFEGNSIWSHWANDKSYGGTGDKGINSAMIRFMFNDERDVWNIDPLLGGVNMLDFEGWSAKDNYTAYMNSIWTDNLPTKYLQHFDLQEWQPGVKAQFSNGVDVSLDNGTRVIRQDGREVLRGGTSNLSYLLPWGEPGEQGLSDPTAGTKMYFFTAGGGEHSYQLTPSLSGYANFAQYKLSATGREKVADISAHNGNISLTGEPGVAYVVVPTGASTVVPEPEYGQHSGVSDPGFNAGNLDVWNPQGGAEIVELSTGDPVVRLGSEASSISQKVTGLETGAEYTLSALIEIGPKAEREVTLVAGAHEKSLSTTPALNRVGADPKHNTYMQRVFLSFVPDAESVEIAFTAEEGTASVTIDDVRIHRVESLIDRPPLEGETPLTSLVSEVPEGALLWDFEDNQAGWGPFVRGGAGGLADARTSISELHQPYSQSQWKNSNWPYNGKSDPALRDRGIDDVLAGTHSLKSYDEYSGLIYRTIPARVNFEPGHKYQVSFSYQTTKSRQYQVVVGADDIESGSQRTVSSFPLEATGETVRWEQSIVAGCNGSPFIGISRIGSQGELAELVIDDFMVVDLGISDEPPTCATVEIGNRGPLNRGVVNRIESSFTNQESTPVTNVGMMLTGLPQGWQLETLEENGNLFETVLPGETVTTTWLLQVGEGSEDTIVKLDLGVAYAVECEDRSVTTSATFDVAPQSRPFIPASSIDAKSSMKNQSGEGIDNALADNDKLWHSSWSESVQLPAWVEFNLDEVQMVDGWGYQQRASGVNGRLRDYSIEVWSEGGWAEVASGTWENTTGVQTTDFSPTETDRVRMVIHSVYPGDSSGNTYTSARQLILFGVPATTDSGYSPGTRPATDAEICADAPSSSITLDGSTGNAGWFVSPVLVRLATDDEEATIWYRLKHEEEFVEYRDALTLTDGQWVLEYYAVSASGVAETVQVSDTIMVDTIGPQLSAVFNDVLRQVTINASDQNSGVDSIEYSLDGGSHWQDYYGSVSVGPQSGTLSFRGRDIAGNQGKPGSIAYPAADGPTSVTPLLTVDRPQVRAGEDLAVTVIGLDDWPQGTIEVGLESTYQKLADLRVDEGRALGTVTIPARTVPGLHSVVAKDSQQEVVASATVRVLAEPASPGGLKPKDNADKGGSLTSTGATVAVLALIAGVSGIAGLALQRRRRIGAR